MSAPRTTNTGTSVFTRLRVHDDGFGRGERVVAEHLLRNAAS